MEAPFCQSCGMPLNDEQLFGTTADGKQAADYCIYCYENGEFTQDITMDEMIKDCLNYMEEYNKDAEEEFTREEAIVQMKQYFPTLKRWKTN